MHYLNELKDGLKRSWLKKNKTSFNSCSVAVASKDYYSGLMESKTHLLDISSEQAALVKAVSCMDPNVTEVVTLVDGEFHLNPIVMKVLCDHVRRTGVRMKYKVFNEHGARLVDMDVMEWGYKPVVKVLDKISRWSVGDCKKKFESDLKKELFECAKLGMETHFSSSTKTCYGSAVLVDGWIYYGGVYSSFDKRMNLHSEMSAFINALSEGKFEVEAIGLVSTKFKESVPHMCGCCRQFYTEIMQRTKKDIMFYGFSLDGSKVFEKSLKEYLPDVWDSEL